MGGMDRCHGNVGCCPDFFDTFLFGGSDWGGGRVYLLTELHEALGNLASRALGTHRGRVERCSILLRSVNTAELAPIMGQNDIAGE